MAHRSSKEQVYEYLEQITKEFDFEHLTRYTTLDICNKLNMSRSLVSLYLNELVKEDTVIKISSRPVYYLNRAGLERKFHMQLAQNEYLGIQELSGEIKSNIPEEKDFERAIGHEGSLNYCISQIKSALVYPGGLPILLKGEPGSGKTYLMRLIQEYCVNNRLLSDSRKSRRIKLNQISDGEQYEKLEQLLSELELIFMGMQAIGASIPPDMIVGSVLGTAFAITTGKGMETAITIAMPAAILSAFVVNLFYGVITPIMAKAADRFAEEGKYMKIEGVFLSNGFLFDLTFAVIAFGAFLFGGDSVTAVVNAIPGWLTTGIGIAAGILPALGFAQLINMIMNKKVAVFFLLGFLLSAYMGISTVGIVCFSVVIVGILLTVKDFVPNQPALQGGMDDDNEF